MMGFDFPWNFRTPYFSKNFSEFWTRWHISLSSWLRDYLYIALGGNRGGKWFTYRNLMLTMIIGGLWHGANWAFVFWGFLHGSYLVIQRLTGPALGRLENTIKMPKFMQNGLDILIVYFFTCLAWIFFRAGAAPDSFGISWKIIHGIISLEGFSWDAVINKFQVIQGVASIGILLFAEIIHQRINLQHLSVSNPIFRVASFAILFWLIEFLGTFDSN